MVKKKAKKKVKRKAKKKVKRKAKKKVKKKVKRKAKKKVKKKAKRKTKKKAAKMSAGKFIVTRKALALLLAAHVDVDTAAKKMMSAKKELARTTFR